MSHRYAYICFETHASSIFRDEGNKNITVFKHNSVHCDIDIFNELDNAADFIFKPLDNWSYSIDFIEEDD